MWLNFQQSNADVMFLYWPVLLIGLTVVILFIPAPILYHRSREWWAYSNVGADRPLESLSADSRRSLGYSSQDYILLSFETSFLEICIAPRHTPWG